MRKARHRAGSDAAACEGLRGERQKAGFHAQGGNLILSGEFTSLEGVGRTVCWLQNGVIKEFGNGKDFGMH
jgi:hypothetical protein